MSRTGTVILTAAVLLALLAAGALFFVFSGLVNVAATEDHLPGVRWFLETTQERSVARHAASIEGTVPSLDDPEMKAHGLDHYHQMCVVCHGAPGVERGEVGKGLNPKAPELWQVSLTPEEMFWVAKHGIRMTGMPAFGETHSDEELWGVVAFIQELKSMSPAEYRSRVTEAGLSMPGSGHHGGESSPGESSGSEPAHDHSTHEH